ALERFPRWREAASLTEEVVYGRHHDFPDRAFAAGEDRTANQRRGTSRRLSQCELGRRGELVGDGTDRRAHHAAVVVRGAAEVVERSHSRDTDGNVDDADAPRPPERVGDDHRDVVREPLAEDVARTDLGDPLEAAPPELSRHAPSRGPAVR